MTFDFPVKINNVSDYALNKKYVVARVVNHEFWFYGADDDRKWAEEACIFLGPTSIIIINPEVNHE